MSGTMPTEQVMDGWRPGSFDHTWQEEILDLFQRDTARMVELATDIAQHGILEPVILGNDGRLWDGHHRVAIAHLLGLHVIPVTYGSEET